MKRYQTKKELLYFTFFFFMIRLTIFIRDVEENEEARGDNLPVMTTLLFDKEDINFLIS